MYRNKHKIWTNIQKHWLLIGILFVIFVAGCYPKLGSTDGPFLTEYTVKYGAVSLIFLISGFNLDGTNIFRTLRQFKLHAFIQLFTFVFVPIFSKIYTEFLSYFGVNPWILKGIITVACMPPPVSTAVILTKAARGNETVAIFNSILGSFLGILITPIALLFNLGFTALFPLLGTIIQLISTVLVPLILGHSLRSIVKNRYDQRVHRIALNVSSQLSLLFIIYTTFCETFHKNDSEMEAVDIIWTIFSVVLMQIILILIIYGSVQLFWMSVPRSDAIAIIFCATHKSLTLGIPILKVMFDGYSHFTQITLPLLVYHPVQVILGGFLVVQLKEWGQFYRKRAPI